MLESTKRANFGRQGLPAWVPVAKSMESEAEAPPNASLRQPAAKRCIEALANKLLHQAFE